MCCQAEKQLVGSPFLGALGLRPPRRTATAAGCCAGQAAQGNCRPAHPILQHTRMQLPSKTRGDAKTSRVAPQGCFCSSTWFEKRYNRLQSTQASEARTCSKNTWKIEYAYTSRPRSFCSLCTSVREARSAAMKSCGWRMGGANAGQWIPSGGKEGCACSCEKGANAGR